MSELFETLYDVCVMGGGMCGVGAALALADRGARVLLVARRPALGWEVTAAFQCAFHKLPRGEAPTAERIRRQLNALGGLRGTRIDAPVLEIALDRMVEQAGIELLLYSQPTGWILADRRVDCVEIGNKQGVQLIRARAFVDATERGLLWRQTDVAWQSLGVPQAQGALFFNYCSSDLRMPQQLGDAGGVRDLRLRPSVRETEVCAEYVLPEPAISVRAGLDRVIRFLRESVPSLRDAAVTHASFEPFPLGAPAALQTSAIRHPQVENLFAAGPWAIAGEGDRQASHTVAGRAAWGERAAAAVVDLLDELPAAAELGRANPRPLSARPASCRADVVVAGGGTAGALAAIAAGRQGASVLLLEASTMLGGMTTGGGVPWYGHGVPGGLQDEFHARCRTRYELYCGAHGFPPLHPELAKVVLEEMCREAKVDIHWNATAIGAKVAEGDGTGKRVRGVIAATPEGVRVYRGAAIVDSTGDADVARLAGAPIEIGRETDRAIHCYSQCGWMLAAGSRVRPTNHDCGYVDPFDVVDLTRARREGIRQMYARWHKGLLGERPLLTFFPLLGLRQGARIVGDYKKPMLEQILPVHYEDCIAYAGAKYDCHSQDFANQQDLPVLWVWVLGNRERHIGGEIPYRCLLPQGIEGLLVACRSASTTNEANYQFRVIRNMHRIGEAAGVAAAVCAELDTTPRALDVRLVQRALHESGALGEDVHPAPVVRERPLEELRAALVGEAVANGGAVSLTDAVWLLAQGGADARATLRDVVQNGPSQRRFWAAVALAWHKDPAALPELIEAVAERMYARADFTPYHRNTVPLWMSAMVLLGRIGERRAVPVLLEVLEDRSAPLDALIAAVRALGRIGDAEATVPALQALLARDDLPRERLFQQTNLEARWPAGEDGLWQIELAAAESLARLGAPQPGVAAGYRRDERNHVRRYADVVSQLEG